MSRKNFIFHIILFLCVSFYSNAKAQYLSENWTTENGLPQNSITSILQTKDGYIWFGTFGGLVRFDGIKFKIFNTINAPAIKSNRIIGLFEDKNGTLWIGTQYGNLISYKNEVFTSVLEPPTTPRAALGSIYVDNTETIWIFTGEGLQKYKSDENGKFIVEKLLLPYEEKPIISSIIQDESNNIWISTSKALYQYQNGTIQSFPYDDLFPKLTDAKPLAIPSTIKILIDSKKRFWLVQNSVLARFENNKFVSIYQKQNANFDLVENVEGSFFLKSEGKVYRFENDKLGDLLFDKPDIFLLFRQMMTDREGNLWIGSNGKGLFRFKQQTAQTFAKANGLTDGNVFFILEDKSKNIWIGADNLYQFRDGKFEVKMRGTVYTAFQSKDETLWFGTPNGLITYKNGNFTDFSKDSGIQSNRMFEDSKGTRFFITPTGLIIIRGEKRETISPEESFIKANVQKIFEDHEGAVWFATVSGVSRYKDNIFTYFSDKDGLSNENVRDIYQDRDGVLWFGTYGGGLNRFKDGNFFPITTREGMNEDIISRIIVDEKDNFWMLGNRGVSVISRSALNDLADGKIKTIACATYDVSDGMLNSEGNGGNFPAGWQTSDGKFWFPSIQGVIVIDPKSNNLPIPPVYIEDIFLSGKEIEANQEIEIPADKENLEIHYTGINFTKPEQIKFKYKLEGFDKDWIEVGNRRIAYYSQLPAGNYRFLVTASTTNGVWNELPASKNLIVLSNPIWKQWWFILSVSLLLIVTIVLFYRLRLFQLEKIRLQQQRFSRQLIESQESERKRIAGEIHDGLGQTLLIIKNRAFLGTKANNLESANEQFKEISESSGEAINQAREIAYFLRPSQLERLGLTSSIEEMLEQVSESTEIKFEYEIDSVDDIFSPENEINVYRIIQESINNILKHSKATEAKVLVKRNNSKIHITIEDNGEGFSNETTNKNRKTGFGLFGIEERISILGGKLLIKSEIGKGTTLSIIIEKDKK